MRRSFWSVCLISVLAIGLVVSMSFTAQAKTEWKMCLGDAKGGTQWECGLRFAELMNAYTGGDVVIHLFPNGQLGSEQETVQNCRLGTLDYSVVAINNITPFSKTVGLFTLPYLILSLDDAVTLTQGPIGQKLVENTIRDAGVRILSWAYSGFRVLTNSKRPVRTLEDLKGLKIRVPKNAIMIASYKSWGLNAIPMAWNETFTALQQRVVDGQDNPYLTNYVMKFYEVQKYVTNIRYIFSLQPLIMSEKLFQNQSANMKKTILKAGLDATEHARQFNALTVSKVQKLLTDKGMEIMDPANNEKEWIEKATTAVWPMFYDDIGGKEKIDEALKAIGR